MKRVSTPKGQILWAKPDAERYEALQHLLMLQGSLQEEELEGHGELKDLLQESGGQLPVRSTSSERSIQNILRAPPGHPRRRLTSIWRTRCSRSMMTSVVFCTAG